eukprot:TRINITY_DN23010_c0_g1_i1.p2 TRINITY_DN23010_c0_g1~~TRINITY_DN23010_c0_g1_i1.p2  ORF type:complete len:251 (+),score=-0.56 TRINITY_DN23010_c0_g1_i1:34-753(+)
MGEPRQGAGGAGDGPLLIHLSTDQVYPGTHAWSLEDAPMAPVNAYGRSKARGEDEVRAAWPGPYVILRSSIIVGGTATAMPLNKTLPLQWTDSTLASALASGRPASFFADEWRCPVLLADYAAIVRAVLAKHSAGTRFAHTLNAGGPDRVSRADMAAVVARVRGYLVDGGAGDATVEVNGAVLPAVREESALIERVPAASVNRGVPSPSDISMDTAAICSVLGVRLTPFEEAVRRTFAE